MLHYRRLTKQSCHFFGNSDALFHSVWMKHEVVKYAASLSHDCNTIGPTSNVRYSEHPATLM